jgi:hypothetical protein
MSGRQVQQFTRNDTDYVNNGLRTLFLSSPLESACDLSRRTPDLQPRVPTVPPGDGSSRGLPSGGIAPPPSPLKPWCPSSTSPQAPCPLDLQQTVSCPPMANPCRLVAAPPFVRMPMSRQHGWATLRAQASSALPPSRGPRRSLPTAPLWRCGTSPPG